MGHPSVKFSHVMDQRLVLVTLLIKLGARTEGTYSIKPLPQQTDLQKQIYRAWLGVKA